MILFDDFGEFFQQIPVSLIVMVCGAFLLLFAMMAWLAYFKPRRNRRREAAEMQADTAPTMPDTTPQPAAPGPAATVEPAAPRTYDESEMPDLDLLAPVEPPKRQAPQMQTRTSEPDFLTSTPSPTPTPAPVVNEQPITKGKKYHVTLHTGHTIESEELVAVMRDPRDGRLVVYVDGTGYRTLVDSPEVKKLFVSIMKELSDVVTKPDENPPEDSAVEAAPEPTPETPEPTPAPAPEVELPKIDLTPPPPAKDGKMPGDLPSYRMDDQEPEIEKGFFGRAKVKYQPVEEVNIASAIEAYLQHKLDHNPEYAGRNLHVHNAPGGLVRIQVGDRFYDAVDDIEDLEIRAFFKATIQEWQSRQ